MKSLVTAAVLTLLAMPAAAATFVFDFEAEYQNGSADDDSVDTVVDLAGALLIGATLTGTLIIDDTFLSGDASHREYAPGSIIFDQIDETAYEPFTVTRIFNGGNDVVNPTTEINTYPVGQLVSWISVFLRDFDDTFVGDSGIPTTIDLNEVETAQISFLANIVGEAFPLERIDYRFTSFSEATVIAPVPLPAGLPLLGSVLALIFGLSRSRRRKRQAV